MHITLSERIMTTYWNKRTKCAILQISDFGLCKPLEEDGQVLTIVGEKLPLKWMALESLQDQQFSKKTDVYAKSILSDLNQFVHSDILDGHLVWCCLNYSVLVKNHMEK